MLNYGLAGRSQNVLVNLYRMNRKIAYKKINIVYSDPLQYLRPDLEASGYSAFAYMFGFNKFQITRVMVSCSLVGAGVGQLSTIGRNFLRIRKSESLPLQAGLAMTGMTLYTPVSIRRCTNKANQHSSMRSWTHLKRFRSDRERVLEKQNRPP
jgi:hypothetical protein